MYISITHCVAIVIINRHSNPSVNSGSFSPFLWGPPEVWRRRMKQDEQPTCWPTVNHYVKNINPYLSVQFSVNAQCKCTCQRNDHGQCAQYLISNNKTRMFFSFSQFPFVLLFALIDKSEFSATSAPIQWLTKAKPLSPIISCPFLTTLPCLFIFTSLWKHISSAKTSHFLSEWM